MDFEPIPANAWPPTAYPGGSPLTRPFNDDDGTTWLMRDVIIGRVPGNHSTRPNRVTLSIGVRRSDRPRQSIDHQQVTDYLVLTFNGGTWTRNTLIGGGQNTPTVRAAATDNPVTATIGRQVLWLADMWDRWHLNTMHPECVHMDPVPGGYDANKELTCPVTGYRYGREWLYEQVPPPVLADIFRAVAVIHTEHSALAEPKKG